MVFSSTVSTAGINNRISRVPYARPKTMDVAIGIKNCACNEVSNKIGVSPAIVVRDVSKTARKR